MKRLNGIKLNPIETWAHIDVTSWHSLTLALEKLRRLDMKVRN